jgi:predicted phage replisome organizer
MKTMADVKWIKITTDIFDDDKILLIESLPEADSIIVIWFKLLCLAGKQNNSGVFMMNNQIAYTDKMLATIFRRKEATIQLALQTFEQFGMIELIDGVITIPNWGKHQSLEQIEARKEYQKEYQREYRKRQKLLANNSTEEEKHSRKHLRKQNVNSPDKKRKEEDKNKNENREEENIVVVRQKYGEYENVLLSDEEFVNLIKEFPSDYKDRIENLSSYMASSGKTYENHYATIKFWDKKDKEKKAQSAPTQQGCQNPFLAMAMKENGG